MSLLKGRPLLVVAGSALLGVIYFGYLRAVSHPPDVVRLVPVIWLLGAIFGGIDAVRALGRPSNRIAASAALVIAVPSGVFACLFAMAALMGD